MEQRSDTFARLVAWAMRAYPAHYRDQYGADSLELLHEREAEAASRGALSLGLFRLGAVPHLVLNGLLERLSDVRSGRGGDRFGTVGVATKRLVRAPGLSATIVLTLALGIGANIALFSLVSGVVLRPLPFHEPERLVRLWETNPAVDAELHGPSPWNLVDWERESSRFESMASWYLTSGTVRTPEWTEELRSAQVTSDFFRTLGVEPLLGRDFQPEETDRYGPLMLSHRAWQRLFGGDPSVVGQSLVVSGARYEIVGVMPPSFTFPDESVETWLAWNMANVYADRPETRSWRFLDGIARLSAGETAATAEEELDAIAVGLAEAHPEWNAGWGTEVTTLHDDVVGEVRGSLWLAFVSVLVILAMACVNVANLLLARVPARIADVRLRVALGATRGRIGRELLTESALLGVASALGGLLVARWIIDGLVAVDAGRIPRLDEVGFDASVLAFTLLCALATTMLFGAAPLLELVRNSARPVPGRGTTQSARHRRLRNGFVGVQLALALVLLSGAGLFGSSLGRLLSVDPGLDPTNVATFRVSLDPVAGEVQRTVDYYRGLLRAVEQVPGVLEAGASQTTPMSPVPNDFTRPYRRVGSGLAAADAPAVQMRIVTPGYVGAMGMTLVEGSDLPAEAAVGEPLVAIVNQTLARELGEGASVVGGTFEIDFREGWQPYRIVGVVQDVRHYGPRERVLPEVFLSHAQVPYLAMTVVARTRDDPDTYEEALRAAVLGHGSQPPHQFVSMESLLDSSVAEERFVAILMSAFGLVALLLAVTGVSGVIAHSVEHRRREIGVRMALGADARRVMGAVVVDAGRFGAAGLSIGLVVAFALGRVIDGLLYDVGGTGVPTILLVATGLGALAIVTGLLQARRVAEVAPADTLRSE